MRATTKTLCHPRLFTLPRLTDLSKNSHFHHRFCPNPSLAAHVILYQDQHKHWQAEQVATPPDYAASTETPQYCRIDHIQRQIRDDGHIHYTAITQGGETLSANHSFAIREKSGSGTINKTLITFSNADPSLTSSSALTGWASRKIYASSSKTPHKGGDWAEVNSDSVHARRQMPRSRSQYEAMDYRSAGQHYQQTLKKYRLRLSPETQAALKHGSTASRGSLAQPEWLHALGYVLFPLSGEPQSKKNLGAGPSWTNTLMLAYERLASTLALLGDPELSIKLRPLFIMLLNSDVIADMQLELQISRRGKTLMLRQSCSPLYDHPPALRPCDIAQLFMSVHHLLYPGHLYLPEIKTSPAKPRKRQRKREYKKNTKMKPGS